MDMPPYSPDYGSTGDTPVRYVSTPVRPTSTGPRHAWDYGAMPPAPPPSKPAGRRGGSDRFDRWWRIADDFWRVAHNEFGRELLHPRIAALGMGAALLAELVVAEFVEVHDDLVYQTNAGMPLDRIGALVMEQIRAEPHELPVRVWLDFLASDQFPDGTAYEHVRDRMLTDGLLVPERYGFMFRKTRYLAAHGSFSLTWGRLTMNLREGVELTRTDTLVGGLAMATDLHRELVVDAKIAFVERLLRVQIDAASGAERRLLEHLETAVGSAVSSGA
ncbi:MAG: GPP34 family phosphoprotein [Actinoplanes sp.]